MNRILFLIVLTLLAIATQAQSVDSTRARPQIGIEILHMPLNALLKKSSRPEGTLIAIEPALYVPAGKATRRLLIRAGYIHYSDMKVIGNVELSATGGYLKAGMLSRRSNWVGFGVLGTVSVWESRGVYRFDGPIFGDYLGQLGPKTNVSAGIEGITEFYIKLGGRWSLAIPIRLNAAVFNSPREFIEPYIPGIGFTGNRPGAPSIRLGAGLNLYLLYQL